MKTMKLLIMILLMSFTMLSFGQTTTSQNQRDSVLNIDVHNIRYNLDKYYTRINTGRNYIYGGIALEAVNIYILQPAFYRYYLRSDLNSPQTINAYNNNLNTANQLVTIISIVSSALVITGAVIQYDAHKYFGRAANISVSPTGVSFKFNLSKSDKAFKYEKGHSVFDSK